MAVSLETLSGEGWRSSSLLEQEEVDGVSTLRTTSSHASRSSWAADVTLQERPRRAGVGKLYMMLELPSLLAARPTGLPTPHLLPASAELKAVMLPPRLVSGSCQPLGTRFAGLLAGNANAVVSVMVPALLSIASAIGPDVLVDATALPRLVLLLLLLLLLALLELLHALPPKLKKLLAVAELVVPAAPTNNIKRARPMVRGNCGQTQPTAASMCTQTHMGGQPNKDGMPGPRGQSTQSTTRRHRNNFFSDDG